MPNHSENLNDSSLTLRLQIVSKKVSLVVAGIGFIVILAWVFDIPALKGILPNLPTMKVNTALCFLSAIAFLLLTSGLLCARPDQGLMSLLCSDGAGSVMARRLLPFTIFLPLFVGAFCEMGYKWHLYTEEVEAALSSTLDTILFSALVGWNAYKLNCLDSHRRRTELAGQQANEQLQQELRSRQQAEEALQVSQARLAGILEVANDAIVSIDEHQCITLFNHEAEKIFGYTAAEVLGQPLDLLVPTRFAAAHHQQVSNFGNSAGMARRMGERKEIVARRKDGTEFPAKASISMLDMGGEKLFTAFMRDISDRQQAQEALVKLAAIVESSNDAIISKSLDGIILSWNAGAQRIFGYSAHDVIGQPMSILIPPDRVDEEPQILQKIQQGERIEHYETVRRHKDGQLIDVSVTVSPIKDTAGKIIGASAIKRDITERKRTEKALRLSEERLQLALEASNDGLWDWNMEAGEIYLSPRWLEMLGYEWDELPQESDTWEKLIHPDDKPWVLDRLNAHLKDSSVSYAFDYRLRTKSGGWKWVADYGKVVARDENGSPLRITGTHKDISDRKRMELELRSVTERLQYLLTASPAVIFTCSPDGDYGATFVSENVSALLGYEAQDFLEDSSFWVAHVHPDDVDRILTGVFQLLEQEFYSHEYRFLHADGTYRWLYAQMRCVNDKTGKPQEFVGYLVDITERKRAEQALRESEEKLRHREAQLNAIVTTTSDGIMVVDCQGKVRFANPAAARLFDIPLEELCDYQWGIPLTETAEVELVRHRGEIRTAEMKTTQTQWLCEPGYVVALRDITERKQFELELQRAKEAAEVANQAKSIFLANMSHELRTPLNVILGFTQVMNRDSSLSPEQFQHLGIISKSGNHLLNLINDVLDLSKIEAGRLTLDESSFDLIALVRSLHEMLRQKALTKGLQFNLEIAPDVPQYVSTDSNKLRQVLINLLGNAIKFTQKGSVTLRVVHSSWFMAHSNEQPMNPQQSTMNLLFEVSDTGVGIAPTELNTIFDAFVQTQAGRVSNEGTGLGLTITQKFVQLMGGDITIKSTLGQGSTFSFEIRVCLANAWEVQPTQTHQQAIGLASDQPAYRILVADDQPENRLLLVKLLTQLGLEVREAKNGQEAVNLWQQWQPHLIWMDMRMPLMDGYAATQQIRSSVEGQSTIIIALTAHASNSDRTLALQAGCNDYVTKPFQEETLFAKMAEHLGLRYLYANSERLDALSRYNDEPAQATPLTPESFSVMPPEWMNQLHQAAKLCDEEEILQLLEQIPSEYTSLITGLSHLVRNYEFLPIVRLTQSISSTHT